MQKQKLEELRFFTERFEEFNRRYDKMVDDLTSIVKRKTEILDDHEKKRLEKYFNLCGEEYLYYRQGLVPQSVWNAWSRGMRIYAKVERVSEFWRDELRSGSYYGLNLDRDVLKPLGQS